MIKNFQQLITLLPLLILGLTIVILIIKTFFKKNLYSKEISISSLIISILFLIYIKKYNFIFLSNLINIDKYSIYYILLILFSSLIISIILPSFLRRNASYYDEFYMLLLISTIGGMFLSISNNFISFFLGLKLLSIPTIGMLSYTLKKHKNLETSIKYIIFSTVFSSLILFGISLIYSKTGSFSFEIIQSNLYKFNASNYILFVGIGMIISGILFYLSLFPFHYWIIDIYKYSPNPTVMFIATVSKLSIFSSTIRFLYKSNIISLFNIKIIFSLFSIISIIVGSFLALNQKNIKKILCYSSITHMGYLIINFIVLKKLSIESINICIFSYILSNIIIFSVINIISEYYNDTNQNNLNFYKGLFYKHPILSLSLSISLFSLSGFPLTIGFISKFYIIFLSIKNKLWWIVISILFGSVISILYYIRIITNMYYPIYNKKKFFKKNKKYKFKEILIFIISLFILILGVYPKPLINFSKNSNFLLVNN